MMIIFLEQFALHLLIAGVAVMILSLISTQFIDPIKNIFVSFRLTIVKNTESLLPNPPTIETVLLSRLLMPYFIIIIINQAIYNLAISFSQFSAMRILLFLVFILTIIYAVPVADEWDGIEKAFKEPIGMLCLIIKSVVIIDYYNPYTGNSPISAAIKEIPEFLMVFLFIFPYSALIQIIRSSERISQYLTT
jgi:hypothetical protein